MAIDWTNPSEDVCQARQIGYNEREAETVDEIADLEKRLAEAEQERDDLKGRLDDVVGRQSEMATNWQAAIDAYKQECDILRDNLASLQAHAERCEEAGADDHFRVAQLREALVKVRHAIDESLGDTDITHEEDDDPLFIAHNICVTALADTPKPEEKSDD